jgi:hypothetical protein
LALMVGLALATSCRKEDPRAQAASAAIRAVVEALRDQDGAALVRAVDPASRQALEQVASVAAAVRELVAGVADETDRKLLESWVTSAALPAGRDAAGVATALLAARTTPELSPEALAGLQVVSLTPSPKGDTVRAATAGGGEWTLASDDQGYVVVLSEAERAWLAEASGRATALKEKLGQWQAEQARLRAGVVEGGK